MNARLDMERVVAVLAALAVLPASRVTGFPLEAAVTVGLVALWRVVLGSGGKALLGSRLQVLFRAAGALATFVLLAALTHRAMSPLAGMLVLLAIIETLTLADEQTSFTTFMTILAASAQVTGAAFVREDPAGVLLTGAALAALLAAVVLFERRIAMERMGPGSAVRRIGIGDPRHVPAGVLLRTTFGLFGGGLLVGGLLWLAIPRAWPFPSGKAAGAGDAGGEAMERGMGIPALVGPSEGSPGIRLGDIGRVKMHLTPYLEVATAAGRPPLLRENTYDLYRAGNWTATPAPPAPAPSRLQRRRSGGGWIAMGLDDDPRRGFDVRMRILIGPMRRLYLERDAVRIRLLRAGHVIDTAVVRSDNEQIDADVPLAMDDIVEERVVPPPRDDGVLERARSDPGVSPRASYVELPAACAPLVGAAREVVGTEQNPWRQAQWLVRWLRSDVFTYTLEMPVVDSRRPVVDFVLEARHGHCEYFASALTLMLRALGHPARIVRGFRGGDFLERRGVWVVRGSNYHAWTEMYFDGPGWVALDATPPDERASDAVTRTRAADETVEDGGDDPGWLARLLGLDPERVARIAETIRDLLERFVLSPLRFLFGSDGGFLGLVLLILLLARLQHRRRAEAWRREAGARTRREAEAPYLAALRVLRGAGVRRRSSQTPREFLRDIVLWAPEVGPDMRWLTSAHERVRYGQVPESSEVREEASTRSARVKAEVRTHRRR